MRAGLVPRPRLINRLNESLSGKLTIVSSPAGFGKTTLLSQWLKSTGLPVGWISLDEGENDLSLFFTYLVAALQQVHEGLDDTALTLLRSPQPGMVNAALVVLLNQIERFPGKFLLVLDDFHLIEDKKVHQVVDYFLEHLPLQMHLVLVTRADPPLHLARLRGQNQLTELRMRDLRFSQDEALEFFDHFFKEDITENDILRLFSRTEGWVTGLQMAAVSMQGKEDISSFVRSFSGTHHYILDYLFEEALSQQPKKVHTFLFKTAILSRLNAPLCNAITGQDNSQEILDALEKANLFIIPLDEERRWFRYHRLFSDLLLVRLEQTYGDRVADLHIKASQWYEQNGAATPAIEHALLAKNFESAIRLVEREAEATLMRSEISTFLRWTDKLPQSLLAKHASMNFLFAWGQMMMGDNFDEILDRVEKIDDPRGWLAGRKETLRAFIAISRVDLKKAEMHAGKALETLSKDDSYFRSIALWIVGVSRSAKQNLVEASQALDELLVVCRERGSTMFAVMTACQLAKALIRQGRLEQAETVFQEALEYSRDRHGNLLPIGGEAMMGLGELYLEINALDKAADHILEGIELTQHWRTAATMEGYLTLAWVHQAQANPAAAQDAIDRAMSLAIEYKATDLVERMVELWQARLWIAQGKLDLATTWAEGVSWKSIEDIRRTETLDSISYHLHLRESVIISHLKYQRGEYKETLEMQAQQIAIFQGLSRLNAVTELQILKALTHKALGERRQATEAIKEALKIAESAGFLRIFLDQGPAIKPLLQDARARNIYLDYADYVLAALDLPARPEKQDRQSLSEPLSNRELDVLRQLRTNLTTPEIAEEMMISVSTVRSHIKNIYGKLSVHKRSEAVSRAEELGLM